MGSSSSKNERASLDISSKSFSTSTKEWRVGLVFPVSYFQDKKKFDEISGWQPGLPFGLGLNYAEPFEDKSQVNFNTGAITFIGKVSLKSHYSDRPNISRLYDGIGEVFRFFRVKIVPQNVAVKVICYPNIAICIKLSGSKEEIAMVKFLSRELIAYPKKMIKFSQHPCIIGHTIQISSLPWLGWSLKVS